MKGLCLQSQGLDLIFRVRFSFKLLKLDDTQFDNDFIRCDLIIYLRWTESKWNCGTRRKRKIEHRAYGTTKTQHDPFGTTLLQSKTIFLCLQQHLSFANISNNIVRRECSDAPLCDHVRASCLPRENVSRLFFVWCWTRRRRYHASIWRAFVLDATK